jgi:hypothetical protein
MAAVWEAVNSTVDPNKEVWADRAGLEGHKGSMEVWAGIMEAWAGIMEVWADTMVVWADIMVEWEVDLVVVKEDQEDSTEEDNMEADRRAEDLAEEDLAAARVMKEVWVEVLVDTTAVDLEDLGGIMAEDRAVQEVPEDGRMKTEEIACGLTPR